MRIFFVLVLLTTVLGCYYDVESELYGMQPSNCDTTNVRYSTTITGIFNSYGCIGCHSAGAPSGNVTLSTYAGARTVALSGELFGAINHSPGFSPMPQGGNKMPACEIQKVKTWIDAGAPQN